LDLEFTDEQRELRASVCTFLARECPVAVVRAAAERDEHPGALWRQMVDLGWPGLTVETERGGVGLGFIELAVVVEELGRVIAPGPFLATVTQFVPAVREVATPAQCDRTLGAVARGEITGALAMAGATGSFSVADLGVVARRVDLGWRLEGVEHHVLDGDTAGEIAVAARVDEGPSPSAALFLVPGSAARTRRMSTVDASRHYAAVELDGVVVDLDRALGTPRAPQEWGMALKRAIDEATVALALETVGTCQTIFDMAMEHVRSREQFGVPIGSFQATKHKFADLLVTLERARATAYFAALTIAEDDERRGLAASMAKAAAGDCQRHLAQEGIQLLGGIGYTWEHDMHLFVKRAKAGDAFLGTAAHHRLRVADLIGM
jgi:alkylation response protein AidB-like acyl-CoA dehydrogenase